MMVDFEAIVRHFWPKALDTIQSWSDGASEQKGFSAIGGENLPARKADLREWLQSYSVFQGFTTIRRDQITDAVLTWADARNPSRDLRTSESLAIAHAELEVACQACIPSGPTGKHRNFTSLASKALWLSYPHSVPIYDSYARNALHILCKIEDGITTISKESPEYAQFVHVWKQLYERYKGTIESLDIGTYPYRVRVFDVVLWLTGQPTYRAD